jgi:hypothetical protein
MVYQVRPSGRDNSGNSYYILCKIWRLSLEIRFNFQRHYNIVHHHGKNWPEKIQIWITGLNNTYYKTFFNTFYNTFFIRLGTNMLFL